LFPGFSPRRFVQQQLSLTTTTPQNFSYFDRFG